MVGRSTTLHFSRIEFPLEESNNLPVNGRLPLHRRWDGHEGPPFPFVSQPSLTDSQAIPSIEGGHVTAQPYLLCCLTFLCSLISFFFFGVHIFVPFFHLLRFELLLHILLNPPNFRICVHMDYLVIFFVSKVSKDPKMPATIICLDGLPLTRRRPRAGWCCAVACPAHHLHRKATLHPCTQLSILWCGRVF